MKKCGTGHINEAIRACMVILHAEIQYQTDEKEGVLETYITLMAEQHGQEWLIRYFQNTPIRSPR
jgi:hypothetical protein